VDLYEILVLGFVFAGFLGLIVWVSWHAHSKD